jgi:hypothetical protein
MNAEFTSLGRSIFLVHVPIDLIEAIYQAV